jgi:hypothetical protein
MLIFDADSTVHRNVREANGYLITGGVALRPGSAEVFKHVRVPNESELCSLSMDESVTDLRRLVGC